MTEVVKIRSNDEDGESKTFEISKAAINISKTARDLIEQFGDEAAEIPLPNVSGSVLEKVVAFCNHKKDNPDPVDDDRTEMQKRTAELTPWEKEFVDVNQDMLFKLILAANYLDIKALLDLSCKTVALQIKGMNADEIKNHFGVTRDFTPEEVEAVKRDHPHLFDE